MRPHRLLALAALMACGRPPAAAPAVREGYATTPDSVRLYFRVVGTGAETVMLNAANYHQQAFDGLVSPGRRVVLYDVRGRGKTDSVPPSKMGIAEFDASDVEVIRKEVGAEKVALVGWSGGALSMFRYAAEHPDRVTHLILIAPVGPRWDPWWEDMRTNAAAKADPAADRALAARVKAGEFATDEAALCRESATIGLKTNWVVTSRLHLAPDVCDSPNEVPSRYGDFVPRLLAKLGHYDWRLDFAKVTARRLVIHGEFDNPPLDGSREWVAGVPDARLLVIKGVGHWPHYEKPEETLNAIRAFLDGGWPAGASVVPAAQPDLPLDPHLKQWVRRHAVPVPPVDEPYADSAWAFLRPMIGTARLLAIGENIHGGHEPLALRNHIIRYAVTQLGFTAVAIESGFTEGQLVDRFVQGESLDVDSVLRHGINNGFDRMPENRQLLLWLRRHNEAAKRKVHFYGIDQTGAGAPVYGGASAVEAALAYLGQTAPDAARQARAGFAPLLDRFTDRRFHELSADEQAALRGALGGLLRTVNGRPHSAKDAAHALAVRNVWAAERLEQSFRVSGAAGARSLDAIRLRDSVMAENSRWVLQQQGVDGRAIVFAHNGHVWDVPMAFPALGPAMTMMGTRLRRALGSDLRVIGMAAATYEGMGPVLGDPSSMENTFARAARPSYALDLRTADRDPIVASRLREPWITRIHAWLQPIVPRQATDIIITLDRITPSSLNLR